MRTLMECTDCKHCISYFGGFRVACGHPDLPASRVQEYLPVNEYDAEECEGFEEGDPKIELGDDDIDKAVAQYGNNVNALRLYAEEQQGKK